MRDKLLIFLVMSTFFATLSHGSISSIQGSGMPVDPYMQRDVQAAYHNNSDDYHLFGSTQWAVRYDFQDFYPSVPDCRFIISKARIFFPNLVSSATVSLYADADSLPFGDALREVTAPVSSHLMEYVFPDTLSAAVIWLMVEYDTGLPNAYVSASAGGGTHSYYSNTNGTNPFFESMNAAGLHCELAFGLLGSFILDGPDLELVSFDLSGNLTPRESVQPVFSIYNHSDISVSDARIRVEFTSPDAEYAFNDSIIITQTIAPHDSLVVTTPGYGAYSFPLPDSSTQLKVKATLVSSFSEPDNLFQNNIKVTYYSVYNNTLDFCIAENFLNLASMETILNIQDDVFDSNVVSLNYFPSLGDSLGNLASRNRFDWYGFNAYPTLAMQGWQRIYSFPPGYEERLENISNLVSPQPTFISSDSVWVEQVDNSDNVILNFQLRNGETLLYPGSALNPSLQSQFFAGLFQKLNLADSTRYVLDRWIAFADTITNPLSSGTTLDKSYTFNRNNLPPEVLISDYCVFYWIQNSTGGLIHFAGSYTFSLNDFPVDTDDHIGSPNIHIFPNPLALGKVLKAELPEQGARIEIFNLRGQLIYREASAKKDTYIPSGIFPTTGIYFIRIAYPNSGKAVITKKISFIK